MKVILTEKVKSLGSVGEVVNVSPGYARNFIIPHNLGKLADEGNSKQMEDYQKMLSKKVAEQKSEAEAMAKQLSGLTITMIKKVGGSGKLFGTVTSSDLAKGLEEKGISVEKRVLTAETAIKSLGEYNINAKLFAGVEATFKVKVEMDPKQAEEMKKKQEAAAAKKAARKEEKAEAEADATEVTEETTESTEA